MNEEEKKAIEYLNNYKYDNEVREAIDIILNYVNNSIPVQKIKDKIEELKQQDREWTEELLEPDSNLKNIDRNLKRIKNQIDVLQELLEK